MVDLCLSGRPGRFGLLHGCFQPFAFRFGPDAVVGGGDLLTGRSGQLCGNRVRLAFELVRLLLRGQTVFLELCSLEPQLLHLLLAGEQPR